MEPREDRPSGLNSRFPRVYLTQGYRQVVNLPGLHCNFLALAAGAWRAIRLFILELRVEVSTRHTRAGAGVARDTS